MFVVASGNPFDGLQLYGPFWSEDDATEWVESGDYEPWDVVRLEPPHDGPLALFKGETGKYPDIQESLVTLFHDGSAELAHRRVQTRTYTWGAPTRLRLEGS